MAIQTRIQNLNDMLLVPPGKKINLKKDYDPGSTGDLDQEERSAGTAGRGHPAAGRIPEQAVRAEHLRALLIILQAMDAAGKDGVIKHVMSGVNPQGTQVYSFKVPSRRRTRS